MVEKSANEQIELIKAEKVDARPLAANRNQKRLKVATSELRRKGREESSEAVNELNLVCEFVRVPHTEEEALPDLYELGVRHAGCGGIAFPVGKP